MRNLVERLLREDTGQDLAEYGVALAVVGVVAASAAVMISHDVRSLWQHAVQVVVVATLRG
jgi:Flp pilus assembly pilin Flp